jgi:hypothetical protein
MRRLLGVPRYCHEPGIESAEHGQEPDHIMLPGRVGSGGFASMSGIVNNAPLVGLGDVYVPLRGDGSGASGGAFCFALSSA